jgi:hypothetical protein
MAWLTDPQLWAAFVTLTVLELVLGIDNIIFIAILAGKLPPAQQSRVRTLGLGLAMLLRIALLFALSWIIRLTAPLSTVLGEEISGRDLILLVGGLFLLGKSTHEIHGKLEGGERARLRPGRAIIHGRSDPDSLARHRVLAGLRDHRRGHDGQARGDDRGGRRGGRVYDGVCGADKSLC